MSSSSLNARITVKSGLDSDHSEEIKMSTDSNSPHALGAGDSEHQRSENAYFMPLESDSVQLKNAQQNMIGQVNLTHENGLHSP